MAGCRSHAQRGCSGKEVKHLSQQQHNGNGKDHSKDDWTVARFLHLGTRGIYIRKMRSDELVLPVAADVSNYFSEYPGVPG